MATPAEALQPGHEEVQQTVPGSIIEWIRAFEALAAREQDPHHAVARVAGAIHPLIFDPGEKLSWVGFHHREVFGRVPGKNRTWQRVDLKFDDNEGTRYVCELAASKAGRQVHHLIYAQRDGQLVFDFESNYALQAPKKARGSISTFGAEHPPIQLLTACADSKVAAGVEQLLARLQQQVQASDATSPVPLPGQLELELLTQVFLERLPQGEGNLFTSGFGRLQTILEQVRCGEMVTTSNPLYEGQVIIGSDQIHPVLRANLDEGVFEMPTEGGRGHTRYYFGQDGEFQLTTYAEPMPFTYPSPRHNL